MSLAQNCLNGIDTFTEYSGKILAWLGLLMALLTAVIVVLRYGFDIGSIAAQEAVIYMHGCLFLLGASYTLKQDAHVRVDIFYRSFSPRAKAWVNSLGTIVLLLPLCIFILGVTWNYAGESWAIRESSPEPGGIPAVYLLKTLLPLMALNLMLQGVAELLRNTIILLEKH
jgi:TRAP-type mannitol/chloroaromatic compound transport system permease small subunit